ncbi:MAG: alanine--tRNA ligase [Ruminococcaceae bacterium]|nr:alanine--tRNA ligase [Oscillospiraceae bacterium]
MEKLGLNEIREKYLSFFESKGHLRLPSFSLVPQNDKSLLLINAGMAPLKPYFTGQETPPRKRVTTCQKCIRTPDIERVGKTARHGTYFEMLGNFSFGDYFKNDATSWAWEFCTEVLKLPVDRLWVSIYEEDDEAFEIWTKKVGVSPDRIVRMGKEDNFWEIGQGPCGPCSELYFDRGEEAGCGKPDCKVGCECDRFVEFWNLVFTQFDKDENGNYNRLAHPNIDTGMGLERIACIMQGVQNLFEVDTVRNIMAKVSEFASVKYGEGEQSDVSLRVITDHIRSTTFMIGDGVKIANEGRGYVLKRLLRRAARHGKLLGINEPFLYKVCETVIEENKNAYPELVAKKDYIKKTIELEEISFNRTVDEGMAILDGYVNELKKEGKNILSGENAFKLSDTYGFPIDLTVEILEEKGIGVDVEGFEKNVEIQRTRSRDAIKNADVLGWKDEMLEKFQNVEKGEFVGYETLECDSKITGIFYDNDFHNNAEEGMNVTLVVSKTPFYGEGGGQVGDTGVITTDNAKIVVADAKKMRDGRIILACFVESGSIEVNEACHCKVDASRRKNIQANHSATHILQKALRMVVGDHVEQAGSFVNDERLRFDFSHYEAVTPSQLEEVEKIVNEKIFEALTVECKEMPLEEAKKLGAMALFGEKYGDVVRVVTMGDFSVEFCGGTHVSNTSNVGIFKILSESGIAAGTRRIEATTGLGVLKVLNEKEKIINDTANVLKANANDIAQKAESLAEELKAVKGELTKLKNEAAKSGVDDVINNASEVNGVKVATAKLENTEIDALRTMGDGIKDKLQSGVAVLVSSSDDKVTIFVTATKDVVEKGVHCGNIVKEAAVLVGGRGGGRPDFAQAGGKDKAGIDNAIKKALEIIASQIK